MDKLIFVLGFCAVIACLLFGLPALLQSIKDRRQRARSSADQERNHKYAINVICTKSACLADYARCYAQRGGRETACKAALEVLILYKLPREIDRLTDLYEWAAVVQCIGMMSSTVFTRRDWERTTRHLSRVFPRLAKEKLAEARTDYKCREVWAGLQLMVANTWIKDIHPLSDALEKLASERLRELEKQQVTHPVMV